MLKNQTVLVTGAAGPMLGFKTLINATMTIAGIELVHRIRKGHFMLVRKRRPAPRLSMGMAWNLALA